MIKDLAKGPLYKVKSFSGYYVNGYKFHTEERGSNSGAMNSGVCIKGSSHSVNELEYYGRLQEILELEYPALPIKRIVLFKCSWFDPILNRGTRIHPQYKLVDVKSGRVFNKYEPFILAVQAAQVYFASYPTLKRNVNDWLAVCKIKARGIVEVPKSNACLLSDMMAFQENVSDQHGIDAALDDRHQSLNDENGSFVYMDNIEIEKNAELALQIEDGEDIDVEQEFDDDDEDTDVEQEFDDDDDDEDSEVDQEFDNDYDD